MKRQCKKRQSMKRPGLLKCEHENACIHNKLASVQDNHKQALFLFCTLFPCEKHTDIPPLNSTPLRLGAYLLHALSHRKNLTHCQHAEFPLAIWATGLLEYLFSISISIAIIRLCSGNFSMHHGARLLCGNSEIGNYFHQT